MSQSPPLQGIRVLEFAGLAPGTTRGYSMNMACVLKTLKVHSQAYSAQTSALMSSVSIVHTRKHIQTTHHHPRVTN